MERLSDAARAAEARTRGYEPEACEECGNFTLARSGTHLKCATCGVTSEKTWAETTFAVELQNVGLPSKLADIIGRKFTLIDGDHVVAGTITSLGYGPEEGFSLYVTSPRFRGINIKKLQRKKGEHNWEVFSPEGEKKKGFFLHLL